MKEIPMLFSAPMVVALLAGAKTQTRRAVAGIPSGATLDFQCRDPHELIFSQDSTSYAARVRYHVGDRLWVREAFSPFKVEGTGRPCKIAEATYVVLRDGTQIYRDGQIFPALDKYAPGAFDHIKWRPGIHMPRWASRLTLEITGVRVQRLQDITDEDAKAEGAAHRIAPGGDLAGAFEGIDTPIGYRNHFRDLWGDINGYGSWVMNPWVWALTFKGLTK